MNRRGSEMKEDRDRKDELDFLMEDRRLKDDTIGFLQREKESLVKEIKHYESMCTQVETDISTRIRQEETIKALKFEISQMKQTLAEQRQRMRVLRELKPLNTSQQTLIEDVSKRAIHLLMNCDTDRSAEVRDLIDTMDKHGDAGCIPWNLLDLLNKALAEIIQLCYRLEKSQPKYKMRYTKLETPPTAPLIHRNEVNHRTEVNRSEMIQPELTALLPQYSSPADGSSEYRKHSLQANSTQEPTVFMRFTHGRHSDRPTVDENIRRATLSTSSSLKYSNPHGISASSHLMKVAKKKLDSMSNSKDILSRTQSAPDNDRVSLPGLSWAAKFE